MAKTKSAKGKTTIYKTLYIYYCDKLVPIYFIHHFIRRFSMWLLEL